MTNLDNSDMDLGLSLGYSNQCIQTRSNSNSGAGVNAGSRVDMTFVASHPLSELVWSPHKGLSLKCADCSLTDRKTSLLLDVGPSDKVLSSSHSIRSRGTNDEKPISEGKIITSQAAFLVDGEVASGTSLAKSPRSSPGPVFGSSYGCHTGTGGNMEAVNTVEGVYVAHFNQKEKYHRDNEEKGLCSLKKIRSGDVVETSETNAGQENRRTTYYMPQVINKSRTDMTILEPLSGEFNRERMTIHAASGIQTLGLESALASEIHTMKQSEALGCLVSNLPSPGRRHTELVSVIEEGKKEMEMHGSTSAPLLENLEFTAENDVQHLAGKDACGQSEERSRRGKSVPVEASPSDSRICLYQRKGKEKALPDRDVNERMSKDEDGSHESMESCNSVGLFSKGKKRWNFEQQLLVGSKRIKRQIQERPASTSLVIQDSSFMNWISNMVKGLAKSNQDEGPSLTLTLDHPNHGLKNADQKIITCNKTHDSGSRNMGFQTIFQSLYFRNEKVQETRMSNDDYPVGGSKELVLPDKTCSANITPISYRGENDKSCKQFFVSNENFNQSTSGSGGRLPIQPWILPANIAASQDTCKTNSTENKALTNLACSKAKDGVSSSGSSLGKQKTESAENNHSDFLSEGKAIHNIGYRSDPLRSLWITRFCPKTACPVLNLDLCDQSTHGTIKRSTDCTRLIPHNHVDFSIDQKSSEARENSAEDPVNVVGKEFQNYAPSTEASIGFKRIRGHPYKKPISILNPTLSKRSEAMASVFARRLDALKHIIPSDVKDGATRMRSSCFFCGRSGHDLRNCSEVKETEMEDLLRNVSSYDGIEESPCLCIRCFQLDHWAIACPVASSSSQQQSEHGASLVNRNTAGKVQLCTGNKRYPSMLEMKESRSQVAGEHIICKGKKRRMDSDLSSNPIWSGKMLSDKRISSLDEVRKHTASNSGEDKLKENHLTPFCNIVHKQISDAPKGIFDTIRRLRLSRMDILKCMNSPISLSNLDGFFLRLRLGKWEEGLEETGYFVACITGAQREKSPKNSKSPISVSIGGIKCLVESQYVSNHDFLEDELMAWWRTTLRSGTIPTEDNLKSKYEERKKLGF